MKLSITRVSTILLHMELFRQVFNYGSVRNEVMKLRRGRLSPTCSYFRRIFYRKQKTSFVRVGKPKGTEVTPWLGHTVVQ